MHLIKIKVEFFVILNIFKAIILYKKILLFILFSWSLFSGNNFNLIISLSSFDLK